MNTTTEPVYPASYIEGSRLVSALLADAAEREGLTGATEHFDAIAPDTWLQIACLLGLDDSTHDRLTRDDRWPLLGSVRLGAHRLWRLVIVRMQQNAA